MKFKRPDFTRLPAGLYVGALLPLFASACINFIMGGLVGRVSYIVAALMAVTAFVFNFWFFRAGARLRNWARRELRARCHWQNLNEKGRAEVKGSIIRHGRLWLTRKWTSEHERTGTRRSIEFSWSLWTHFWALQLELCGGDSDADISVWVACGLFSVHLTFEGAMPQSLRDRIQYGSAAKARVVDAVQRVAWDRKDYSNRGVLLGDALDYIAAHGLGARSYKDYMLAALELAGAGVLVVRGGDERNPRLDTEHDAVYGYWSRRIGVRAFDYALWFSIWEPDGRWSRADPQWWSFNFHYINFLLGRPEYSTRELETARIDVPMPEKAYPATVVIEEAVWRRKRWPWPHRLVRAEITPDEPIPFPGKGENSYDCGMDATYALTTVARTPAEAVSALVASVMRDRERYGGRNWKVEAA